MGSNGQLIIELDLCKETWDYHTPGTNNAYPLDGIFGEFGTIQLIPFTCGTCGTWGTRRTTESRWSAPR